MDVLIGLFIIFVKLSLFSFGGGFVMVPIAMAELEANQWATAAELTDAVAIATMSPGPVGVNLAVALGFKVAGFAGAFAAFLGISAPTTMLVILVAAFFFKIYKHHLVTAAFHGLRPVITGIILYAAISLALKNGIILPASDKLILNGYNIFIKDIPIFELKSLAISLSIFLLLLRTAITPIFLIILSGFIGIVIF